MDEPLDELLVLLATIVNLWVVVKVLEISDKRLGVINLLVHLALTDLLLVLHSFLCRIGTKLVVINCDESESVLFWWFAWNHFLGVSIHLLFAIVVIHAALRPLRPMTLERNFLIGYGYMWLTSLAISAPILFSSGHLAIQGVAKWNYQTVAEFGERMGKSVSILDDSDANSPFGIRSSIDLPSQVGLHMWISPFLIAYNYLWFSVTFLCLAPLGIAITSLTRARTRGSMIKTECDIYLGLIGTYFGLFLYQLLVYGQLLDSETGFGFTCSKATLLETNLSITWVIASNSQSIIALIRGLLLLLYWPNLQKQNVINAKWLDYSSITPLSSSPWKGQIRD